MADDNLLTDIQLISQNIFVHDKKFPIYFVKYLPYPRVFKEKFSEFYDIYDIYCILVLCMHTAPIFCK
jgi:hypothetical protein